MHNFRLLLGIVIGIGFLAAGIIPISGGFEKLANGITGDEVTGAFELGGVLESIGVLILVITVQVYRRRDKTADKIASDIYPEAPYTALSDDDDEFAG